MESLDFPEELQDPDLWTDAISIFDKFALAETPLDKLSVLLRTIRVCSSVFQMASVKAGQMMTADDEFMMLIYIIAKSSAAKKLYTNYM